MLITVNELKQQVEGDLPALVGQLQQLTGRKSEEEAMAWKASLPKLTEALSGPAFGDMHVYFAGAGSVALEYQPPAASAWCDVVLLGQQDGRPTAIGGSTSIMSTNRGAARRCVKPDEICPMVLLANSFGRHSPKPIESCLPVD